MQRVTGRDALGASGRARDRNVRRHRHGTRALAEDDCGGRAAGQEEKVIGGVLPPRGHPNDAFESGAPLHGGAFTALVTTEGSGLSLTTAEYRPDIPVARMFQPVFVGHWLGNSTSAGYNATLSVDSFRDSCAVN